MSMENFYNQVNRFLKQVYNNLPQHDDVSLELNQTNIKVTFGDGNEFEIRAPGGICFTEKTIRDNINDEFAIRGLKIYEGEKGPFISMPSRKIGDKFEDVCFPITSEGREKMTEAVIKAYEQKLSQQEEQTHEEENSEKKSGKGKRQSHKQSDGQKENENREEMSEGQEEQTADEPKIEM